MARKLKFPEQQLSNTAEQQKSQRQNTTEQRENTTAEQNRQRTVVEIYEKAVERMRPRFENIGAEVPPTFSALLKEMFGLMLHAFFLLSPFIGLALVFLDPHPLTYYRYEHDAKPIPVFCSVYDRVKKRCAEYSHLPATLILNNSILHFKRPVSFYTGFKCYLRMWDSDDSNWDYYRLPCFQQNSLLLIQIKPYEFYDGQTGMHYLFGEHRLPRLYIKAVRELSETGYDFSEEKNVMVKFVKVKEKSY